jgi:hypothetical protein
MCNYLKVKAYRLAHPKVRQNRGVEGKGYCNLYCSNGHYRSSKLLFVGGGCKSCINAWNRKRRAEVPELYRKQDRERRARNYEHNRILERQVLLNKFGMTMADYELMFAEQKGSCAICKRMQKQWLSVDHDHATGKVRGLLCTSCNLKLGFYEKYLTEVKRYLEVD